MRKPIRKYLLMAAGGLFILWLFCLPRDLFKGTPYSTVVVDRNGELLGARISEDGQWRFPPCDTVPDKYATALIQFEDRGFRHHPGISLKAIGRALVQNIRGGHTVSGASTISMQVIRLSRQRERTVWQKLTEMLLATRLEARYTKDEILALYASHAPFGGNVVGLDAAAWRYLGRDAGDLSWAEAATFAVLPNAPSSINLGQNRQQLLEKRNRLLHRLHKKGSIDDDTYASAVEEPLIGEVHPLPSYCPHLVEEYNRSAHGNIVKTGIDLGLQRRVEASLRHWRSDGAENGINDLAAVIVDVKTGETMAYCGNADMDAGRTGAWVDIARAPRSTGSILKPLLYCAALQEGVILPLSLLPDIPTNFGGFSPKNFDLNYDGAVPADEALARSLNIPNVWLLKQFGTARFASLLKEMGISTLTRKPEEYGLSLILGGSEACLADLVQVYSYLARFYQGLTPGNRLHSKTAVWYTLETMAEVGRPDQMDWRRVSSLRKVAWKTGTSYGSRDAWAIGITPDYVVGVWAGNAEGNSAPGLTGALTAGPVMFDLFNLLPATDWFDAPDDAVEVDICPESGYLAGRDCPQKVRMRVPQAAVDAKVCPWHREIQREKWFVLPPLMERYYRIKHQEYSPLPHTTDHTEAMHFAYPSDGAVLSPARQMDGSLPGVRCEVVHSRSDATVYWHLDSEYLGETSDIHNMLIEIPLGFHRLTAVDDEGTKEEITIKIL